MHFLVALVMIVCFCLLLIGGLATVLRDMMRRDFTAPAGSLHRLKGNRYGISATAPARGNGTSTG